MISFRIDDMTCGHCAARIARAVSELDPDARLDVRLAEKLVHLVSAAPASELADAIREAGYTPREVGAASPGTARGGCCCRAAVDGPQAAGPARAACCG
jgi:copper chaperone